MLVLLALNRTYVEPYTSPFGQALLAVLLSAYVAALLWMRQMTLGEPNPRFLAARTAAAPVASPLTMPADENAGAH